MRFFYGAPGAGFEPTTKWLTATCSTTELPRNSRNKNITLFIKSARLR